MKLLLHTGVIGLSIALLTCLSPWDQTASGDYVFGQPEKIPNVSRPGAGAPRVSPDGLELYFGYDGDNACGDLWVARRSTVKEPWGAPARVDFPAGSPKPLLDTVCVSPDGLELYFGEAMPGQLAMMKLPCTVHPSSIGQNDLWVARRTEKGAPWGQPENVGSVVNSSYNDGSPCVSADGLSLYFTSERPGGFGVNDIYVATRKSTGDPWDPPANLGSPINTLAQQMTPFISPDGLSLYYAIGDLQSDVYMSTRTTTDAPWGNPVKFDPVNSSTGDGYLSYIIGDPHLYFGRGFPLTRTTYDVWQVKVLPVVDFNADGKVDGLDLIILGTHWGQMYAPCDIAPPPFGDGFVDVQDLLLLAEHMDPVN